MKALWIRVNLIVLMVLVVFLAWAGPGNASEVTNAEILKRLDAMGQLIQEMGTEIKTLKKENKELKAELEKVGKGQAERPTVAANHVKAASVSAGTPAEVPVTSLVKVPETTEGLGASFEVLYMRPSRSNLDYATVDSDTDGHPEGSLAKVEPDRSGGGRFGLSYNFGSGTAVYGQYMKLNSKYSDNVVEPAGGSLWATWTHTDSTIDSQNLDEATMNYDFDHEVFDLGVKKWLEVGNDFGMQIDAGLRHAKMKQNIDINYQRSGGGAFSDVHNENNFSGWGPRLGLGLDWQVGKGFSLFGSAAGSVLMGDFDMNIKQVDNGTTSIFSIDDSEDNRVVPVLEMRAGLEYAYQLENGMFVGAKVGYEWQNWFNMVVARRNVDDVDEQLMYTDTTDVSLDGFFLEGFINF